MEHLKECIQALPDPSSTFQASTAALQRLLNHWTYSALTSRTILREYLIHCLHTHYLDLKSRTTAPTQTLSALLLTEVDMGQKGIAYLDTLRIEDLEVLVDADKFRELREKEDASVTKYQEYLGRVYDVEELFRAGIEGGGAAFAEMQGFVMRLLEVHKDLLLLGMSIAAAEVRIARGVGKMFEAVEIEARILRWGVVRGME